MAPLPFSRNLDVKLIKLVEQNPILYNTKHEDYLETDKRDVAWQMIGDQLNRPAPSCKTRWINIRDNMRRKIRARERGSMGGNEKNSYKYKYEDHLVFLKPYFKGASHDYGPCEKNEDNAHDSNDEFTGEEETAQVFVGNENFEMAVRDMKPDVSGLFVMDRSHGGVGADVANCCSISTIQERGRGDPIDVFLDAVGATLRNLNPYYLNQAKSKIFQVVQDSELQQIVNKGEQPSGNMNIDK